ncbi:MAG: HAMP domain-containing histidine kinase [Saprospiraceae bacterium]|nr:HAMP domain-containing histidine kinase [Saprospiraceae bacterium]
MEEKQVQRIKVNLSNDLPLIKIDMGFTSQALYNLLQNALTYGGGGEIEVGADLHDGYVDLYVKDQGPGLDEEDALKVFDKFYRTPGSKAGGIGWSLAVVKDFVKRRRRSDIEDRTRQGLFIYLTFAHGNHPYQSTQK